MASTIHSPRQPLSDLTNDIFDGSPSRGQRRSNSHERTNKRKRASDNELELDTEQTERKNQGNREVDRIQAIPRRQHRGIYGKLQALRNGDPAARRLFTLPTIRVLESFVSSNKADIYKCHSWAHFTSPPYACAFSHASKRGQSSILAVATEEGTVDLLNTIKRQHWDPEPSSTTLNVHDNGIFDIKWSPSDVFIATASGDHTLAIADPKSSLRTAICSLNAGHSHTVKCVAWDPCSDHKLVSGGRDGSICLWDLRTRGTVDPSQDADGQWKPILFIPYAHEAVAGKVTKKGRTALAPRSVTSVVYVPGSSYEIISGGASDGILRKWDLRMTGSTPKKRSKSPLVSLIDSAAEDPTTTTYASLDYGIISTPTRRARGVISLVPGIGPSTGRLFALSNDSRIHTYNAAGAAGVPLGVQQADQAYTHRHMSTNSFYVRAAISPCGRWLASGGANGAAFLFDVGDDRTDRLICEGVELRGQVGEVGAIDWADSALATCADDGTVRIWRPDIERHRKCTEGPEEAKWDWCWGKM